MFYKEFSPHYLLQPFVDCIWIFRICSNELVDTQIIPPDESSELIFSLGIPYKRSLTNFSALSATSTSHIIGLKTKPHFVSFSSGTSLVGVRIRAGGLRALLSYSAETFTDRIYGLRGYFGKEAGYLEERLFASKGELQTVEEVEKFLFKFLKSSDQSQQIITTLAGHIRGSGGNVSLDSIANKFDSNYKSIERNFRKIIGLTPKEYAKLIRFNTAFGMACKHSDFTLTQIAHRAGYFDQSHFIRDCKALTNQTPRELVLQTKNPRLSEVRSFYFSV